VASASVLLIGCGGHALSVLEALGWKTPFYDISGGAPDVGLCGGTPDGSLRGGAPDDILRGGLPETPSFVNGITGCCPFKNIAIIDLPEKVGTSLFGVPVIGVDGDLATLRDAYSHAVVSLGSVGDWQKRERLYRLAAAHNYAFPAIIHNKAYISSKSVCGFGLFAGIGAVVNAGCSVGDMCILNTGCIVEHKCEVGPFVHVAPGAVLCGGVRVGAGAHIGANSVVLQGVHIGANSIIGAGSVVMRDVPDNFVALGNPCRIVREKTN